MIVILLPLVISELVDKKLTPKSLPNLGMMEMKLIWLTVIDDDAQIVD